MKKYKQVKGFNMNRKTGHVSYTVNQYKDKVTSLGFTHNADEKYSKKSKLKYNINPKDKTDCYVKHDLEYYNFKNYKSNPKYKNYRIHDKDRPLISSILRRNKKR